MQAMSADGVIHEFPDGTDMSVVDRVMKSYSATMPKGKDDGTPDQGSEPSTSVGRGLGLGVRNVAEGFAGSLPGMAVDALTFPGRALMRAGGMHVDAPSDMVSKGLTAAGVPEPETSGEKLRGAMISGAASALPTMGLGSIAAAENAAPEVAKAFTQGVAGQMIGGAGAGAASEGTRQLGGGELAQAGAGLVGGLVGGVAGTMATQRASAAIARIGAAKDIDEAIAAAGSAADAPVDRPIAQWMQPALREEPALTGEVLPPETPARPQSMAEYLKANSKDVAPIEETPSPQVPTGAPAKPITTSADAKAVAHAWYQRADQLGAELPPAFSDGLVDAAEKIAPQTSVGRAVAGDTEVTKLVNRLQDIRGEPITLQGAQEIYEYLGDAISKEYGLKGLSKDGHNLMDLQSKFWNMIQSADPSEVAGGTAGFKAWEQGRDAWAQAMKMIDVERIINRAEMTDNPATSIRTGVRTLLNSNRVRGFTEEEISALKDAGNRGALGSLLHVFGSRLVPIGLAAHGAAALHPLSLVAAGAAHLGTSAVRDMATRLQEGRAGNAMSVLGESVPPAPQ